MNLEREKTRAASLKEGCCCTDVMGGGSYVFGGDEPGNPTGYIAYNDVWSSSDGKEWQQMTAAAPWHPREKRPSSRPL